MALVPDAVAQRLRGVRWVRTIVRALRRVGAGIHLRWLVLRSRRTPDEFDAAHGVRTRVATTLRDFYGIVRGGGYDHQPCPPGRFVEVMASLEIDFEDTVFVDYGSGAGRAVLLAAQLPFKAVIGIEASPKLHAQALANVEVFRQRHAPITLVCADARAYELPSEPAVLFFYNPFVADTMRQVLTRIEASLRRCARPVTIIAFDCDADVRSTLNASPYFTVVQANRGVTVLKTGRVGSAPP